MDGEREEKGKVLASLIERLDQAASARLICMQKRANKKAQGNIKNSGY